MTHECHVRILHRFHGDSFWRFFCPSISIDEGISLIEQHGEEHAEGLIGIVEAFEDSAAGTAGGLKGVMGSW